MRKVLSVVLILLCRPAFIAGQSELSEEQRVAILEDVVRFGDVVARKPLPLDWCSVALVFGHIKDLADSSELVRERVDEIDRPCGVERHSTVHYNRLVLDSMRQEIRSVRVWITTTAGDHIRRSRMEFRVEGERRSQMVRTDIDAGGWVLSRAPDVEMPTIAEILLEFPALDEPPLVDRRGLAFFEPLGSVSIIDFEFDDSGIPGISEFQRGDFWAAVACIGAPDETWPPVLRIPDTEEEAACDPTLRTVLVRTPGSRTIPLYQFETHLWLYSRGELSAYRIEYDIDGVILRLVPLVERWSPGGEF